MQVNHIAIIPDGNRRWAKRNALKPWQGHAAGINAFQPLLQEALDRGIYAISAWMASTDNLQKRPKKELEFLYASFEQFFDSLYNSKEIEKYEVRVNAFGNWRAAQPPSLVAKIERVIEKTKGYTKHVLTLFDGYDGITEMTDAVNVMLNKARSDASYTASPTEIKKHLYSAELPSVDLVIRTGGEPHWSGGFMMWDIANAHFHFSDVMWPDFTPQEFVRAIDVVEQRDQRLGK